MKYQIYLRRENEKVVFYDTSSPVQELALIDPNLHIESDCAGNFEATFPITNVALATRSDGTKLLDKMITRVFVTRNDDVIWSGRLLSLEEDFYKQLHGYFEGAYSYLADSNQVQKAYGSTSTLGGIVRDLINRHNSRMPREKNFIVGTILMNNEVLTDNPFYIDYCNTLEAFEKLRSQYGGHMRVRYESGMIAYPFITGPPCYYMPLEKFPETGETGSYYCDTNTGDVYWYVPISSTEIIYRLVSDRRGYDKSEFPIIDWFETYDTSDEALNNAQTIDFGVNLMDFTKKKDGSALANIIMPVGKVVNSGGSTAIGTKFEVTSYNGTYTLLQSKPDNWDEAYFEYFYKERNVYVQLKKKYRVPEWKSNTYYSLRRAYSHPILREGETEPQHWATNYTKYYMLKDGEYVHVPKAAIPPPYDSNLYYINGLQTGPTGNNIAWGSGFRIKNNDSTKVIDYIEDDPNYTCIGFWDSGWALDHYGTDFPNTSFRVYPDEIYYIQASGGAETTLYAITENHLGRYDADPQTGQYTVADFQVLESAGAVKDGISRSYTNYKEVKIPNATYGNSLWLNVCARVRDNTTTPPITLDDIMINIYGSRKVPDGLDERITLIGLADGTYDGYLSTDESNQTVYVEPQPVADGWFVYPKIANPVNFLPKREFPKLGEGVAGQYYCDTDTGNVYFYTSTSASTYEYKLNSNYRGYYKNEYCVVDQASVNVYGPIEKIITCDSVSEPSKLREIAASQLFFGDFEEMNLEVNALDLAILKSDVESPDILDPIRIHSIPHGIDIVIPLQERDIPFNDLGSQTFSIGYEKTQRISAQNSLISNS